MFSKNSKVWVPSKIKAWALGKIVSNDETAGEVKVDVEGSLVTYSRSLLHFADESHFFDFDDLCGTIK